MMCRLKKILPVMLAVVVLVSGCAGPKDSNDGLSLYDKIQKSLETLETYHAVASIRYISNNNSHDYTIEQYAKITGEYRIEVTGPEEAAGNITIFDGKVISQYNKNVDGKIAVGTTESLERSEIFLTSFINNYFAAKETAISVANIERDDDDMTILEANVPGGNTFLATEKLFIDNETIKPRELVIYDEDEKERIVVVYLEVEYNVDLDDKLFSADADSN